MSAVDLVSAGRFEQPSERITSFQFARQRTSHDSIDFDMVVLGAFEAYPSTEQLTRVQCSTCGRKFAAERMSALHRVIHVCVCVC